MKLKIQKINDFVIQGLIIQSYGIEISVKYKGLDYHVYPQFNELTILKR